MSSLKESHSVKSNTLLTVLCIIASISSSLLWVFLMMLANETVALNIGIILVSISGIITLLTLVLFNSFKR